MGVQMVTFRRYTHARVTKCGRVLARYFYVRSLATDMPKQLSLLRLLLGIYLLLDLTICLNTIHSAHCFSFSCFVGLGSRFVDWNVLRSFVVCLESQE